MMAGGEADQVALLEATLFVEALYRLRGADFRGFCKEGLSRTLEQCRVGAGQETVSALQGLALRDPQVARAVCRQLSAIAHTCTGAPQSFQALRYALLPILRASSWPTIWVAECAGPQLVMQLAAMLEEEGLRGKTQLYVTNANEDLLQEAQGDCSALPGALREHIVWGQYDLASDATFKEFDVIVCERPLDSFDTVLQQRALRIFQQSLCNFGLLQVCQPGPVVAGELARAFTCLLIDQGIYRRLP